MQSFENDSSGATQFTEHPDQPLSDLTVLTSIPVSVTTIRPPGPRQPLYAPSQASKGQLRDQPIVEEEQQRGSQRVVPPGQKRKVENPTYNVARYASHMQSSNFSGEKRGIPPTRARHPNQPLSKSKLLDTNRPPLLTQPLFGHFQARNAGSRDQATVGEEQEEDSQGVGQPPGRKKTTGNLKYHGTRYTFFY